MSQLVYAQSFRDLIVYQKARELAKQVFKLSIAFPRDEIYLQPSQIRRASSSVGAQIAEAWAKRRYEKHFISKLTDADGEQMETQIPIPPPYARNKPNISLRLTTDD